MNMLQAVGDLAKVCVEEKVAAGWGVMEGQVVGRHPEGSGGVTSLSSALLSKPLCWLACTSIGSRLDCRAAPAALLDSLHLPPPALLLISMQQKPPLVRHKSEKRIDRSELSRELSAPMTAVTFQAGSLLIPTTYYYAACIKLYIDNPHNNVTMCYHISSSQIQLCFLCCPLSSAAIPDSTS